MAKSKVMRKLKFKIDCMNNMIILNLKINIISMTNFLKINIKKLIKVYYLLTFYIKYLFCEIFFNNFISNYFRYSKINNKYIRRWMIINIQEKVLQNHCNMRVMMMKTTKTMMMMMMRVMMMKMMMMKTMTTTMTMMMKSLLS